MVPVHMHQNGFKCTKLQNIPTYQYLLSIRVSSKQIKYVNMKQKIEFKQIYIFLIYTYMPIKWFLVWTRLIKNKNMDNDVYSRIP